MTTPDMKERQLAALSPLVCAATAFIHPVATTIVPFVLYLFLRKRPEPFAATYALRTADLAFTLQLVLILTDLLLVVLLSMEATAEFVDLRVKTIMIVILLSYFFISLAYAVVQGFRGITIRYLFSFRLAERVFAALQGRNKPVDDTGQDV
jgi:hypothetical protein